MERHDREKRQSVRKRKRQIFLQRNFFKMHSCKVLQKEWRHGSRRDKRKKMMMPLFFSVWSFDDTTYFESCGELLVSISAPESFVHLTWRGFSPKASQETVRGFPFETRMTWKLDLKCALTCTANLTTMDKSAPTPLPASHRYDARSFSLTSLMVKDPFSSVWMWKLLEIGLKSLLWPLSVLRTRTKTNKRRTREEERTFC